MRLKTLSLLCCAECRSPFSQSDPYLRPPLNDAAADVLTDGAVICPQCGAWYPIESGLLDLRPIELQDSERRARVGAKHGLVSSGHQSPRPDLHKSQQERFFTEEAEGYERDVVGSPFYQALDDLTVHRWGALLPASSVVLDIGAGTGRVAIRLAERGHYVIALDLTEALLRQTQAKASAAGVIVDTFLADAETLPVLNGALDAVAAHGVLHHLTAPASVIGHAGRALREGGRWFSLDPHRSPLRGVFDAAMRLVPLWKEEAAPDALQTEERLLTVCRDAGIHATASYSCYVLPHLLAVLPRAAIRVVLRATDALFQRSIVRNAAGVIHVWGTKGDRTESPPSSLRAGSFGTASGHALISALVLFGVLLLLRGWQVDSSVALNSSAYYMGGLDQTIAVANAPVRWGALMVDANGGPLEQGLDDIGYALALQMLATVAGPVAGSQLAQVHQTIYAAAALLLAWVLSWRFRSIAAGVIVLALLLILGRRLAMLVYGQVSNQTITSVFPLVCLAALTWWTAMLQVSGRRSWVSSIVLGTLAGVIDLTRHSHGLALLLASAAILVFAAHGIRRRAQLAAAFVAGFIAVTIVIPAAIKLHRDVTLNRYQGWRLSYLQKPPQHHIYYTLLTSVGRYPNSLGLRYEDRSVDQYITSHSSAANTRELIDAARPLWFQYIREHPAEYARTLVSGAFELPWFVAYTTFMAERRWTYGWPAIVDGLDVDEHDVARYGQRLLMNVRYRYLDLSWWQWTIFGTAWAMMAIAAWVTVRANGPLRNERVLIGAALIYLAFVALPRALVPVQGMDLIFAFWSVAVLCAVSLWRAYPATIDQR